MVYRDPQQIGISIGNAARATAVIMAGEGNEFSIERYEEIRDVIYTSNLSLLDSELEANGVGNVQALVPGAEVVPQSPSPASATSAPALPNQTSDPETMWRDLFAAAEKAGGWGDAMRQHGWYDNRGKKATGEYKAGSPDFKRKSDGAPLWINSKDAPDWVQQAFKSAA